MISLMLQLDEISIQLLNGNKSYWNRENKGSTGVNYKPGHPNIQNIPYISTDQMWAQTWK